MCNRKRNRSRTSVLGVQLNRPQDIDNDTIHYIILSQRPSSLIIFGWIRHLPEEVRSATPNEVMEQVIRLKSRVEMGTDSLVSWSKSARL